MARAIGFAGAMVVVLCPESGERDQATAVRPSECLPEHSRRPSPRRLADRESRSGDLARPEYQPGPVYTWRVDEKPSGLVAIDFVRNLIGGTLWLAAATALVIFGDSLGRLLGLVMLALLAVPASIGIVRRRRVGQVPRRS